MGAGDSGRMGRTAIAGPFARAGSFSEGLAPAANGLFGYIDRSGKQVIAPAFSKAERFHCGLARVTVADDKSGYINRRGEFVWQPTR